jgi:hypothetical protein
MLEQELREDAISAVKKRHTDAKDLRVIAFRKNVAGAALATVQFSIGKSIYENFVWFARDEIRVLINDDELLEQVTIASSAKRDYGWVLRSEYVPGVIALIFTFVVAYLVFQRAEIPGLLANALTLILGFYFGKQASARNT